VTEQVREQVRKENTTKRVLRLFERVAKQIEKDHPTDSTELTYAT
jgi:hypothetical protein